MTFFLIQCEAPSKDHFYFLLTAVKYEGDTAWIYWLGLWAEVNSLFQRLVSAGVTVSVGLFAVHSLKKRVWKCEEHWGGRNTILRAAAGGCKCYACHSIFGWRHRRRSNTPAKWWKIKRIKIDLLIEDVAKAEQAMKKSLTSANNLIHHCAPDSAGVTHSYHTFSHTNTHSPLCGEGTVHQHRPPLLWILLEHHPYLHKVWVTWPYRAGGSRQQFSLI